MLVLSHHVYTNNKDCHRIGRLLAWTSFDYFNCESIVYVPERDEYVFYFQFTDKDFDTSILINDVVKAKEIITRYLTEHSDNMINNKKVTLSFEIIPGDSVELYNYHENEIVTSPTEFVYYGLGYVPIAEASPFQDAYSIALKLNDESDLAKLSAWKNLKWLYLTGIDFTEEQKSIIKRQLPSCQIIYGNDI